MKLPENTKIERSGYAGIRAKEKPIVLMHTPVFDTTMYRYLAIRAKGDTRQWFVNLRTNSIYPTHIWQHRLYFQTPGEWETILVHVVDVDTL